MDVSKFIAKCLALLYLSVGMGCLVSTEHYRTIFESLSEPSIAVFVNSTISIIIGMLIIKFHNIWEANWKVLITIIGWSALIKGLLYLILPNYLSTFKSLSETPDFFLTIGIFYIGLGLIFGYFGLVNKNLKVS